MQALLACYHHGVARLQAVEYFNLARPAQAHFDLYPLSSSGLLGRARQELDDKLLAALRNNGLFRHHPGVVALAKHGIDPGKHAGPQLPLPIVNTAAHAHRTAIGINQGVNRLHLRLVLAAWQRVNVQQSGLPRFDLALKAFWQTKINKHRLSVFQVNDVCTVF